MLVLRDKNSKLFFIYKTLSTFLSTFYSFLIPFSFGEGTFARKSKEKPIFPLLFAHLFVPLQRISTL